jgi:Mrp family chromosome partitioning ATPase/capsular polysaccharide biosynthesis protein
MATQTADATEKLNLQDYLAPVSRFKWIVLALAVGVAAATYVHYHGRPRVYESSTNIYLGQSAVEQQITGTQVASTERDTANAAELVHSQPVATRVAQEPGTGGTPEALLGDLHVVTDPNADVLTLVASWSDPQGAARLANAFAQAFLAQRKESGRAAIDHALAAARKALAELQQSHRTSDAAQRIELASRISQLETLRSVPPGDAVQLDHAKPPTAPSAPRPARNAIFAFVLALAFGVIGAYAINRIDRRIRHPADVGEIYDLPLVGTIPRAAERLSKPGPPVIPASLLEPFRTLRTSLEVVGAAQGTLLVTSGAQGEGKSTIVRNLGIAYRDAGKQVAIVEADLRQPTAALRLATPAEPGLTDVLSGDTTLDEALHEVFFDFGASPPSLLADAIDNGVGANGHSAPANGFMGMMRGTPGNLCLLPSGSPASDPPTLLGRSKLELLLGELCTRFDVVLIDTPPLLAVSDAMPLIAKADWTLLVSRVGRTTDEAAEHVAELVDGVPGARVLGVVANDVPLASLRARYGYREHAPTG